MINLETYLLVFSILQAIFTFTYPKLKHIPLWILIPLLLVAIFFKAISKANYKLRKNHKRLKDFVKVDLTQTTFINGPPGTGKTLLNVSLSLASEENFIDELECKMLEFEQKYKYVNFAKIRADYKNYEQGFFKEYINWYKNSTLENLTLFLTLLYMIQYLMTIQKFGILNIWEKIYQQIFIL